MGTTPVTNPPSTSASPAPAPGAGFEVSPAQGGAQVSFLKRGVQPPSNLYILNGDSIRVTLFSLLDGIEVDVSGRILQPDGRIVPFEQACYSNNGAAGINVFVPLTEGFLLDVAAITPSSGIQRGMVYALLAFGRGGSAGFTTLAVLYADYVFSGGIIGWPYNAGLGPVSGPGFMGSGTLSGVAPANAITVNFLATMVWQIKQFNVVVTTDATAGNRAVGITMQASNGITLGVPIPATIPPSTTANILASEGNITPPAAMQGQTITAGYPPVKLWGPGTLTVSLAGKGAADEWGISSFVYEQWLQA